MVVFFQQLKYLGREARRHLRNAHDIDKFGDRHPSVADDLDADLVHLAIGHLEKIKPLTQP